MKEPVPAPLIYHITPAHAWRQAVELGQYLADSLQSEGFIHCSTRQQVVKTGNLFFHGQSDLLLLEIDPTVYTGVLRIELAENGDYFPHIYGPIRVETVVRVMLFTPDADGNFKFPEQGTGQK